MFRFGKYIRQQGPYSKYKEPVSMVKGSRNTVVKASGVNFSGGDSTMFNQSPFGGGSLTNSGSSGNSGYNVDRYNPVFDQLEEGTILEDWIPRDAAGLDMLFRRIYLRDPIIGPGVDIISNLPWSSYSLAGIKDKGILKIYEDSLDALQIELLMPEVTKDHLVIGRNIMSAIFNERKGIFSGVVPHDPDFIRITPLPVHGFDPLCDFKLSPSFRKFLNSLDPRARDARRALPPAFLDAAKADHGFLPLDPIATIYLARKASQHDQIGTSLLTRCLYFWAIEKALLNAQMASTRRRSRSFVHLVAGIENTWEPTPEELDALAGMVIQANEDPVGGVVATRTGVSISEPVGSGQDFYKWSDELDLFAKYKMQAIGISEAMLSGDACLVASTLIPTNKGLVRIGDLGDMQGPEWQNLDLVVGSRYRNEQAVKWLYNGYKETLRIETQQGNSVQCTPNHPVLVLNEEGVTEWKRAEHVQPGDMLCLSTKACVRDLPLEPLNLPDLPEKSGPRGLSKEITKPEFMTTDLAFLLGVISAEGSVYNNQVRIPNTDEALLAKCSAIFESVFGLSTQQYVEFDPEVDATPERWNRKKNWELVASSNVLVHWLDAMGMVEAGDTPPSYRKKIPDCVLQATEDIWAAYLAGHIEGDGCFGAKLNIKSFSPTMIQQLGAMFNAMGYLPKIYPVAIELNNRDAKDFFSKCEKHMVGKKPSEEGGAKARNRFGIPWKPWQDLLATRLVETTSKGSYFINDQHEKIFIPSCSLWRNMLREEKRLLYDRFERGAYTDLLNALKLISVSSYQKLGALLECRYQFTEVTDVTEAGPAHVYDISMADGVEPAFVANGLIVHNTYNNAEQARSVFVENLATLRHRIVHKMFYMNLFPTLARLHGFVKRTKAEIDHNIRVGTTSAYSQRGIPVWAREANLSQANRLTTRKAMDIPISELIMPQIDWAKQLKPNQDEKYLEILERLKQNDYPVTLKQWAQAAGLNPETILQEAQDNSKVQRQVEKINQPIEENIGSEGEGGGGGGGGIEGPADLAPSEAPEEAPAPEAEKPAKKAPAESPEAPAAEAPAADLPPDLIIPQEGGGTGGEEIKQSVQALLEKVEPLSPDKLKGVY